MSPSRNLVLKTGIEWEIFLEMDQHTFRRHLRVTWAQFDFLLMKFEQQGVNQGHHIGGRPDVPPRKKAFNVSLVYGKSKFIQGDCG